ncbi:6-pyruvoyl trahydropterin synthase family protein [Halostella litorea]|uniref:6-pyruvoyl trahydropterin synthase family protein n=1 Tax=Halostella litorea TaxID=2528831 RepID=UPI001092C2A6|nr:6-carboxytetrahydropterin synthase [Halostella litorea]
MATLEKHFELDAGHRLSEHEFDCQNLHGHRYRFEVEVEGSTDPATGMVVDFANVKDPVMEAFDHNFVLNADDPILAVRDELEAQQEKELHLLDGEPTAENIAEESLDLIVDSLSADERDRIDRLEVRLFETPNSSVTTARRLDDG